MKALLVLEDGTVFQGKSFTGPILKNGEVIFFTGMTGYQEILTDPSFAGQLVCMTHPHIGNCGMDVDFIDSLYPRMAGMLVREYCSVPSNWRSQKSMAEFMTAADIAGIEELDTRALTVHLRNMGTMRGVITTNIDCSIEDLLQKAKECKKPSPPAFKPYFWTPEEKIAAFSETGQFNPWPDNGLKMLVYDLGAKKDLLPQLYSTELALLVVPAECKAEEALSFAPEAIFITGGPGDPEAVIDLIGTIERLAHRLPVFGEGLGMQVLGLALDGKIQRMRFGHHGPNQPVRNLETGKVEITFQNHRHCIKMTGTAAKATYVNINDGTLEGFIHEVKPIAGIQFDLAASVSPFAAHPIIWNFREMLRRETGH